MQQNNPGLLRIMKIKLDKQKTLLCYAIYFRGVKQNSFDQKPLFLVIMSCFFASILIFFRNIMHENMIEQ